MQQAKLRQDFFFFFFFPLTQQRNQIKDTEELACNSSSTILIHSVTNCLFCAYYVSHILSQEYDKNEGIVPSDAYKSGAAKLRFATTVSFYFFHNNLFLN